LIESSDGKRKASKKIIFEPITEKVREEESLLFEPSLEETPQKRRLNAMLREELFRAGKISLLYKFFEKQKLDAAEKRELKKIFSRNKELMKAYDEVKKLRQANR
jgi:predicted transcriptional regulator